MISLNNPTVPLGTGDRGFSLLKEVARAEIYRESHMHVN
ncbi:Uncharacterised protein [Rikenella microfusus]|uniref:Uncharacterized protein n=1 Tax=Rikenella microfusus TaxID=28139 RepID=A0A379MNM9_9BACT|nr:Uncharacterised protein [Rikenella microfusus]